MEKEQTNFRIDSAAKKQAYAILAKMGLTPTDAVNMFMHHIAMYKELPFHPRLPNKETKAALNELKAGKGRKHKKTEDFYKDLGI